MLDLNLEKQEPLTIEEFQEMLTNENIRIANVPAGRYFVHKDGKVISMSTAMPRYVAPIRKVTGEYFIILYSPELKAFDLAQLVISTFNRRQDDAVDYIFANEDMSDCSVNNLEWVDVKNANVSRRKASSKYIQEQIDLVSQAPAEVVVDSTPQDSGFFELPVGIVEDCIVNTKNLRRLMENFCESLNSHLHTHHVDEEDHYHIRMSVTAVEHMITLLDLPLQALTYIIATPPKALPVRIIYEQARHRLKGLLDA